MTINLLIQTRQEKPFDTISNTFLVFLVKPGVSAQTKLQQSQETEVQPDKNLKLEPTVMKPFPPVEAAFWKPIYSGGEHTTRQGLH